MIQLYFLSVLCNSLAGYILFTEKENDIDNSLIPIKNPTFYLILGILCIVTGVLKLLSPTLDGILILGDLVPALSGVIAGFMLVFGIYRKDSSQLISNKTGQLDNIGNTLLVFRKPIGVALLAVSLLHFFLPKTLFF